MISKKDNEREKDTKFRWGAEHRNFLVGFFGKYCTKVVVLAVFWGEGITEV